MKEDAIKFTYSVIDDSGAEDLFSKQFFGTQDALSVKNICELYNEHTHSGEGTDTFLTEHNFRFFGGKTCQDTIVVVFGDLTVRLTRHTPANKMSQTESGGWMLPA